LERYSLKVTIVSDNEKKAKPCIGNYLDGEKRAFVEMVESGDFAFESLLTPERKREIEAMARAPMNDAREKIPIRVSKTDVTRLK
jgi:hypothetical protein